MVRRVPFAWLCGLSIIVSACGPSGHVRTSNGPTATATPRPTNATASNPRVFALVGQSFALQIRSVATGALVRTLASQVGSVALSTDGSAVYYQGDTERPPFRIFGQSTAGGG